MDATSQTVSKIQLHHNCQGGAHHAFIARVVEGKLEFICRSCKERYYWDAAFLQMLAKMVETDQRFVVTFD